MSDQLDSAAGGVGLMHVYQPVVSLPDQQIAGWEALARWPSHSQISVPEVFARAAQLGRLDDLDHDCAASAALGALNSTSAHGMMLFINSEPGTRYLRESAKGVLAQAASQFKVVFELTERGMLHRPDVLLDKVSALRADGFLIALDDVGLRPDSLSLLDVLAPDIIKLDLQLIQEQPDRDQARTLAAVLAHHERTGAVIVAEGIETETHMERAVAYGASLGQGFLFGGGGPITGGFSRSCFQAPTIGPDLPVDRSLFTALTAGLPVRTVGKDTLAEFFRQIESLAAAVESPPIVLTTVQHAQFFPPASVARYQQLAETSSLVAVFGRGLTADLGSGLRGVDIDRDDPLHSEWTILVLGPDSATALTARECTPTGPVNTPTEEADRRFEMALTFDRPRVALAARNLLQRVA